MKNTNTNQNNNKLDSILCAQNCPSLQMYIKVPLVSLTGWIINLTLKPIQILFRFKKKQKKKQKTLRRTPEHL
jgi:hypothetical protein